MQKGKNRKEKGCLAVYLLKNLHKTTQFVLALDLFCK